VTAGACAATRNAVSSVQPWHCSARAWQTPPKMSQSSRFVRPSRFRHVFAGEVLLRRAPSLPRKPLLRSRSTELTPSTRVPAAAETVKPEQHYLDLELSPTTGDGNYVRCNGKVRGGSSLLPARSRQSALRLWLRGSGVPPPSPATPAPLLARAVLFHRRARRRRPRAGHSDVHGRQGAATRAAAFCWQHWRRARPADVCWPPVSSSRSLHRPRARALSAGAALVRVPERALGRRLRHGVEPV